MAEPIKDLSRKPLEAPESDEIKANVDDNLLEAPSPSQPSVPQQSFETGFPESEQHPVQGYQQGSQIPPAPSSSPQPSYSMPQTLTAAPELVGRTDMEKIQQLAESIIHEKWQEFSDKVGNIEVWKEKTETNITSVKQELIRTQQRFENIEKAVLHKVTDYNKTMESVNTELKAMEKAFEKIVEPLTSSIKDLKKLTKDLKK